MRVFDRAGRGVLALCTVFIAGIVGGCSDMPHRASAPTVESKDGRFIIENDAGLPRTAVARVRRQLEAGLAALTEVGIPLRTDKFPITVRLKAGPGVSQSFHGAGPIELVRVAQRQAPIIHELTHMMAGYTRANGHWTEEGLAAYMQDKYGEDFAYPTYKRPHGVMKVILEEGAMLPMTDVMKDRDRKNLFTVRKRWERWLAYSQSSSFCKYLIETYGIRKFMAIYDKPYEKQDFRAHYGKPVEALIAEWLTYVRSLNLDLTRPRRLFQRTRERIG